MASILVLDLPTSAAWNLLERRRRLVEVCLAFAAIMYMALLVEAVLDAQGMLVGGYILLAAAGLHQFGWERRHLTLLATALPLDNGMREEADRMALWERGSLAFLGSVGLLYVLDRSAGLPLGRFLFILGLVTLAWFMLILHRSTYASRLLSSVEWRTAALPRQGPAHPLAPLVMPLAFVMGVAAFLLITPGPPSAVEATATVLYGFAVIGGLFLFRNARLQLAERADSTGHGHGVEAFLWGWEHASYTFGLVAFSILLGVHRSVEPYGGPLSVAWLGVVAGWAALSWLFIRQHRRRLDAVREEADVGSE